MPLEKFFTEKTASRVSSLEIPMTWRAISAWHQQMLPANRATLPNSRFFATYLRKFKA